MVATAIEEAADAGLSVLRSGGNAIDAAVATSLAISVVDPGDSGIGGAGLATIYLRDSDETLVLDSNAVCPSLITSSTYELLDGISPETGYQRVKGDANVRGYKSISVPGLLSGLDLLLKNYGSKKMSELVQPALKLARDGFRVNRYVAQYTDGIIDMLRGYPETLRIFAPQGVSGVGTLLVQPDLAQTLKTISQEGADAFYQGRIADRIIQSMEENGGLITRGDLSRYKPLVRKPAVTSYRGFEVSVPPVGSGGNALIEALNIVENFDLSSVENYSPEMVHLLIETLKLVWADRLQYDADPDFADVKFEGLLSKEYARERFQAIDLRKVITSAKAGSPSKRGGGARRDTRESVRKKSDNHSSSSSSINKRDSHTTQITVVDKDRNMVSLTQTVWDSYGSLVTVPGTGVVMNNGQSRIDPDPRSANRPEPGKRVLSNMCPTIVTKDGRPIVAAGTPGGRRIIGSMLTFLVNFIDYKMDTDAINMPRLHCETTEPVLVESMWIDKTPVGTARRLWEQGHRFELISITGEPNFGYPYISGPGSAIMIADGKGLIGTADSRQPGAIRGF